MVQDSKRFRDFARFALENLSDGAYLITKEGRIVHVNDAACVQVGYTREEMIGMSLLDINPGITQESWDAMWPTIAREKKRTFETLHRTKDGHLFPVEILANYLEFDGAEYSCAFARDITLRRTMERRVRQAEKMEAIGQLAGGVAHDFNNQLAGIVGFADLLRMELKDRPDLASMAEAILKAAKRSSGLTAQLLAFSRQGKYQSAPVDLHQIIDEVVTLLGRSIDKTIHVSTKYLAAPAVTEGDPSQLQNAVLNLAINARDAMPTGGELTFATSNVVLDQDYCARSPYHPTPGKYIRISVIDTGTGMSAETQERMFEPFFTTKGTGKGTGMGLAAVYGTMKSHKGAIGVYSELGHGTEVKLYFPQTDEAAASSDGTPSTTLQADLQKTVLLVEDEAILREMMSGMLQRLGCKVILAKNGREAVDIFHRSFEEIDLVILDLVMPELGGRGAYVQLRKIQPTARVIIASGYSLDSDVQNLLDEGAKGFIQKPFRLEEIAKAIIEAMEDR